MTNEGPDISVFLVSVFAPLLTLFLIRAAWLAWVWFNNKAATKSKYK